MKCTVNQQALQKYAKTIQGVSDGDVTIDTLRYIILNVEDGMLSITATDLDMTVIHRLSVDDAESGAALVHGQKFFEVVKHLPNAPVQISSEENNWVTVRSARSKFKLTGIDPTVFPAIPQIPKESVKIQAQALHTLLEYTHFAVFKQAAEVPTSRLTLGGVRLSIQDTHAEAIGTDGHRLAYLRYPNAITTDAKIDVSIPRKAAINILKLCGQKSGTTVTLSYNQHLIACEIDDVTLIVRTLPVTSFPKVDMILDRTLPYTIQYNTEQFKQSIERVMIMNASTQFSIKMHINEQQTEISSYSQDYGEGSEVLDVGCTTASLTIRINPKYILDGLRAKAKSEIVDFKFLDANTFIELNVDTQSDCVYRYIVMPLRLE